MITRNIFIFITVCCLSGCMQSTGVSGHTGTNQHLALQQAEKLMQLSEQSPDQQGATYRLQAIEHLISADSIEIAERSLKEDFKGKLDTNNTAFKNILIAQVYLAKQDLAAAKQQLRNIWTPLNLPENLLVKFYTTRAEVYRRSGNLLDSVQERIYLSKHLKTSADQKANNEIIWDTLSQLTPNNLKALQTEKNRDALQGWLEFTSITKQYDASPEQLLRALTVWKGQYPNHAANNLMPHQIAASDVAVEFNNQKLFNKPKKLALMLPLQGAHGKSAQAIRDGFLAAFYAQRESQSKPTIQVYDTSVASSLSNIYNQAMNDGADFIVGPLTKEEVDNLSDNIRTSVPVLALNNTTRTGINDNIFQFSLSPEMEAQAVARKAWHDGHRTALIIIPKSAWGQRMKQAFQSTWLALGGKIMGVEEIQSQTNLTAGVKHLLAVDASEERAKQLKQLGIKFSFDPRRRQDIDMVFIATNAALARQVKPLLNFYFAADLPAYASSSIFSGKLQPGIDQDLNGIKFCDMPWILDVSISSRSNYKAVSELWAQDFEQYARLYAMGLDAYKIAVQIDQLTMLPDLGISGMTGMLTLDKQQYIQRKLTWATFKKGTPYISGEQR